MGNDIMLSGILCADKKTIYLPYKNYEVSFLKKNNRPQCVFEVHINRHNSSNMATTVSSTYKFLSLF
jgi:hypothetical protein